MKNKLREQMREKRRSLSPTSYAKKSLEIQKKLLQLPEWKKAARVLLYVSNKEEVDTHSLLDEALESHRHIFVPKVIEGDLVICPFTEWEDLKPGTFGILEPCEVLAEAHPESMDLIVVPGLAFDESGHRLGYGGGFYDKLLKLTKGFKVGFAFSEQVVEILPREEHDVPLDLLITEESILTF